MFVKAFLTVLFIATAPLHKANPQKSHDLKVAFTNIEIGKGKIYVQLLDPAEVVLHSEITEARANASVIFKGLAPGKYWVRVYQDLNNNAELDMNYFGIPKEPYGFSNNIRPVFGPPDTEDLLIQVSSSTEISIKLL